MPGKRQTQRTARHTLAERCVTATLSIVVAMATATATATAQTAVPSTVAPTEPPSTETSSTDVVPVESTQTNPEIIYPSWFKESFLDLGEDIVEARDNNKRLMIIFHQAGCPYCRALVEHNLSQSDITQTLKTHFDVVVLNLWGDRDVTHIDGKSYTEKEFAKLLKVQFTPTTIFLSEDAQLALRLNGYQEPAEFRIALDYVATRSENDWSYIDYVAAHGDKKKSEALHERPYFSSALTKLPDKADPRTRPFALLFEQRTCPNCETLHDDILSKDQAQPFLNEIDLYRVDMWSESTFVSPTGVTTTGRQLARSLDVGYAPTMIFYSARGYEIIRNESFLKSFHVTTVLDYVASGAWRTQPEFQRFLNDRADRLRASGQTVDVW